MRHRRIYVLVLLTLIILLGSFLRFYNSYNGLKFFNEPARDLMTSEKIWEDLVHFNWGDLPSKGPHAETFSPDNRVNTHHGAFYFYLLVLSGVISNFHPYGLAAFVILLNIIAIYLIYLVGKNLFGELTGLIGALLLSLSSFAVMYSIYDWNPNLIIFFLLLTLLFFLKIYEGHSSYWPLFGFSALATAQFHILGYIFTVVICLPLAIRFLKWPGRKIAVTTIVASTIPVLPEIISELSSSFSLTRAIFVFLVRDIPGQVSSYLSFSPLVDFMFRNMGGFGWRYDNFFGISPVPILLFCFLFCVGAVILRIGLGGGFFKVLRINFSKEHGRLIIELFIFWAVFSFLIIFLSQGHFAKGPAHTLLFVFPLGVVFFSAFLSRILTLRFTAPFGIIILAVLAYTNIVFIYNWVWINPKPAFRDQKLIVGSLERAIIDIDGEYELETEPRYGGSILWFIYREKVLPPVRLNGAEIKEASEPLVHYQIFNSKMLFCNGGVLEGNTGYLKLYRCPTGFQ